MAFVWRVEDAEGRGMYQWGFAHNDRYLDAAYNKALIAINASDHPGPGQDSDLGYYSPRLHGDRNQYLFGFANLAQMKQWLYHPKVRQEMTKLGLRLVKYKVDKKYYRRSKFQAIFIRGLATMVEARNVCYDVK